MFDSMNPVFRNPVGAVPAGQTIHFKINPPRGLRCSAARTEILCDQTGERVTLGMFWCGMDGDDREWWECDFQVPAAGLYFYHFSLETGRGAVGLFRAPNGGGKSTLAGAGAPWQITAYSPELKTPDWLAGGVIYQIFPDRLYSSGTPKSAVPADRRMHAAWTEEPEWRPDEKGEITNSDYFGGDLRGIEEKLPYLSALGVTCIYLNPIFEAHSNHRYNTADYEKIDPLLGNEADFVSLCRTARRSGIRILLDGVFSHTGSDSVYFNSLGRYAPDGACQSRQSPYAGWYEFTSWPGVYKCWWGIKTLPNVRETEPTFNAFINGPAGVVRKWLALGAAGWRLDVADELPDAFLDALHEAARAEKGDALVLGEVWEDASNKAAYGQRRRYLLGGQLDSVMNYPYRAAILGYLTGRPAEEAMEVFLSVVENYPPQALRLLMNHIGTHDTERALTLLGGMALDGRGRAWQSSARLSPEERGLALLRLRLAAAVQFTLPGVPCIYYGDEAGLEGCRDPFNRRTFPWGREDRELTEWYRALGGIRASCPCLKEGAFYPIAAEGGLLAYCRQDTTGALLCAVNRGPERRTLQLEERWSAARVLLSSGGRQTRPAASKLWLEGNSCILLYLEPD